MSGGSVKCLISRNEENVTNNGIEKNCCIRGWHGCIDNSVNILDIDNNRTESGKGNTNVEWYIFAAGSATSGNIF